MSDKETILTLVGKLSQASANHYAVVNTLKRGKPEAAATRELAAASELLRAIGVDASKNEVAAALGWCV